MEALGGTLLADFELQESQGLLSTAMIKDKEQDEATEGPCSLKQSSEDLNQENKPPQIDFLQFQNNFFECIEELKICRTREAENDVKINQLVSAQHDYHQTINEEKSKMSVLLEKHSEELCEQRRLHEESLHQLEAEKNKLSLASESMVKEMKELKNDIKTLQLTKYSLDKTIKDQDQRLQMQGSVRSTHLSKMTELEVLGRDIMKQYNLVAEQLKRLEVNVKEAQELNSRLTFINEHQSCSSQFYKEDLKTKTDELIRLKALLEGRPNLEGVEIKRMQSKLKQSQQQVKQKETHCRHLLEQLEVARRTNKTSLEALARSQQLAERHLVSSDKNTELASSLSMTVGNLEKEIIQLHGCLRRVEEELRLEKQKKVEIVNECQIQEESLKTKLRAKEDENQGLIKDREHLEELNSSWSKNNNDLIQEIQDLKKQLVANEERERNMPQKLTKSTNTEFASHKKLVQVSISTELKNFVSSEANDCRNDMDNPKRDIRDNTTDKQMTEKQNIIANEDLTCIEDRKQVVSKATDQTESTAIQGETADKQSAAEHGESLMVCQAGETVNSSIKGETNAKPKSSTTITVTNAMGSTSEVASEAEVRIHNEEVQSKADTLVQKPKEEVTMQPVEQSSADLEASQTQSILSLDSKEVIQHTDEEKLIEVAEQKALDETLTKLGSITKSAEQCFNVADVSEKLIMQVASEGAGDQLSTETIAKAVSPESIPPKDSNSKVEEETSVNNGCLKDTQNTSTETSLKTDCVEPYPQANLLAPQEKICLPIPNMYQANSNELDFDGMLLSSMQFGSSPLTKNNNTDQEKVSENIKMSNWLPARPETSTRNTPAVVSKKSAQRQGLSGVYGLGLIRKVGDAPQSLGSSANAKVSSTLSTPARIATRSTYALPGFSLLTRPRHGVAVNADSCLNLPPSPHGIGLVGNRPGTLPVEQAKETPSLRNEQDSQGVPQKLLQTKAKQNSQEWPNFAEAFDSEPNTEQESIDDPETTRPYPTQSLTTKLPEIGSKRPAEDRVEPLLFSDDDDVSENMTLDIASQINQIQRFLRNDRLKRPKRSSSSKEPVV
ncbi:rootletin-like isoform X2 [Asterias rubens]|uniref:rootletin-like isoform X2 n=1 Tax=Asterias rubens TaxID=7604 RepID=UPI0014554840|nr:rootletin-like isoform X2 [Asterias rubens]